MSRRDEGPGQPSAAGRRRRVLFLVPSPPRHDAADGGNKAVAQLISALAARHDVALLCLRLPSEPPVDEVLQERCKVVEEVNRPLLTRSPWTIWKERRRIALLLEGAPPWVRGCSAAEYRARLRALAWRWQPDVVQIEYAVMGQYAGGLADVSARRILVDLDVAGPDDAVRPSRSRLAFGFRSDAWMRYRTSIMRQVDAVVVLTERDQTALRALSTKTPIFSIPLAVELPSAPLDPIGHQPPSVLFVGNYGHPPNVEAARRLVEGIFPRLRLRHPDLLLHLVGQNPPTGLARDGVVLTGRVPDVTPYLDAAAVVAAPLHSGGGMRVKVLEALTAGKAVVASARAIEGLDVVDGEQVLLAEDDDAFAAMIHALLEDPGRRAALASQARAWAVANVATERSVQAYESLYDLLDRGAFY